MSVQVGELYASLNLDTKQFDENLNKSEGKASKFGGVLSTALGFVAGGVITKGLDIVGGAIGGIADAMIGGNAEFERYQTQFGVLLGSTDAAKERLAQLAKFGASTPFELPELVKADKVLTSFGIHSEDMLTIVGDVAAGTGASFEDMALLMGKFSAGSTGEVISRFQEMGIATKDELAKMGIEFDKAGSMTTPVAEAMPILEKLMKDKFGGMMNAQSQTFEGMVSNLQDWLGQTGRLIGQPIFEVLKDKLGALLTFLSSPEVQAGITNFAQALATGIGNTIDFISNTVIPAFTVAWNTIGPIISAVIPIIQQVMGAFAAGGTSSTQLGETINWLKGIWQSLQPVINAVTNVIRTIVTTIFTAIQKFLEANGDDIKAFLSTTWNSIKDIITTLVKIINITIVPIFNAIAKFIKDHGDTIQQYLTNTWTIIKSVINIALALITGIIKVFLAVLQGDWQGAWNAIKTMVNTVWENIKTLIGAALSNIKIVISAAWDAIKGVATAAWNGVKNSIDSIWNGIKTVISSAVNSVKTTLSGAWDSVKSTASSKWDSIKTEIGSKFDGAKSKIDGVISDIKGALSGAWSSIEGGVRSAWEGIADAAASGFDGITGKIKGIVNQAIGYVNRLIDAYNEVAGTLGLGTLSHIPKLARGTLNFAGGAAIVGEFGPETVILPKGSRVIPAQRTETMANKNSERPSLMINQYITQAGSLVDEMDMALAYYNATY